LIAAGIVIGDAKIDRTAARHRLTGLRQGRRRMKPKDQRQRRDQLAGRA
jgi:hypothetical protein